MLNSPHISSCGENQHLYKPLSNAVDFRYNGLTGCKSCWRRAKAESNKLAQLLRGFLHFIVQAVWHLLMICNILFLPSNLFTITKQRPSLCETVRSSASCKLPVAPRAMIIALAEETEGGTLPQIARLHNGSPTAVCLVYQMLCILQTSATW